MKVGQIRKEIFRMGVQLKRRIIEVIRPLSFWRAYHFCRRAGEASLCSLKMAILSRFGP